MTEIICLSNIDAYGLNWSNNTVPPSITTVKLLKWIQIMTSYIFKRRSYNINKSNFWCFSTFAYASKGVDLEKNTINNH